MELQGDEMNEEILRLWNSGHKSLAEIGQRFEITRERVRQLINKRAKQLIKEAATNGKLVGR